MAKLFILCGYPFAGKSTIANLLVKELGLIRIALDDINTERGIGIDPAKPITPDEWRTSYDIYHDRIAQNLTAGRSVIADTVAYKKQDRDLLRHIAEESGAAAIILYVNTPLSVVNERWLVNRRTKKRSDVRNDDFEQVIVNFEPLHDDENVLVVLPTTSTQDLIGMIKMALLDANRTL